MPGPDQGSLVGVRRRCPLPVPGECQLWGCADVVLGRSRFPYWIGRSSITGSISLPLGISRIPCSINPLPQEDSRGIKSRGSQFGISILLVLEGYKFWPLILEQFAIIVPNYKFPFSSEKLTADVALAHAPTLQGPDVSSSENLVDNKSLEQLITADPRTVPHNSINGSSSTYLLSPEKLVAGAAESSSHLTMQDPDVSSLDEFLDSSLEESITANQLTIDGSSNTSPFSCGKLVARTMESASAPILQGLDDLSLDDFLGSTSEESNSPRTVPHNNANESSSSAFSLGSILVRYPQKCLQMFYITLNRTIRTKCLPDLARDLNACYERNLVEALVDQYNDYHDISEICSLSLSLSVSLTQTLLMLC
jgi:hypothetical protein